MLLLALVLAPANAADCGFADALASARRAWRDGREADFREAVATTLAELECAPAPLPRTTAADLHEMLALEAHLAWVEASPTDRPALLATVERRFAAERALDATRQAPDGIDPDTPAGKAWAAAAGLPAGDAHRLRAGTWYVDGASSRTVPGGRASLLQGEEGARYLDGDPLPREILPRPSRTLALAAAPALVASAAAFGVAAWSRDAFREEADDARAAELEGTNAAAAWSGVALGLGGAGLLGGALVVGRW